MSELRVVAERAVSASADLVYHCIADFDHHHPRFLTLASSQFRVEDGGVGAGTVHSFRMTAGGRARAFRMRVDEPEPGRVLTESDERSSMATTWVVTQQGPSCRGGWMHAGRVWVGVGGSFARLFAPRVLRQLYDEELERLDRYVRTAPPE